MSYPHPDDPMYDTLVDYIEEEPNIPNDEDVSDALRDSVLEREILMEQWAQYISDSSEVYVARVHDTLADDQFQSF